MSSNERLGGMLIFVLVFLGIFMALIIAIPSQMVFSPDRTYTNYYVPENFDPFELGGIAYFVTHNVSRNGFGVSYDFSGQNSSALFEVTWYPVSNSYVTFEHCYWYLGPIFLYDDMNIETAGDYAIVEAEAISHWVSNVTKSKFYPVWCNHARVSVWLDDPNSTRDNIEAAWNDGILQISIGFGFDGVDATLNGWSLVGALLTFQSPELFGATGLMATMVNLLISLPVYGCIGYLVYRLILMAIPFVGG